MKGAIAAPKRRSNGAKKRKKSKPEV